MFFDINTLLGNVFILVQSNKIDMVTIQQGAGLTSSEIKTFQSATSSELAQAESLIARGKEGATRGDFRLSRIVNVLKSLSQDQVRKAISEAKAKGLDVSQVEVTKKGFGFEISGIREPAPAPPTPTAQPPSFGAILLKASEIGLVEGITSRGRTASIPETGQIFAPTAPTSRDVFSGFLSSRGVPTTTKGVQELLISRLSPESKEFIESRQEVFESEQTTSDRFLSGVGSGVFEEVRQRPTGLLATLAIGGAIGFGVKGAGALATRFVPKAVPILEKGLGVTGVSLGALFVGQKGLEVIGAEGAEARGEIVGETTLELGAFLIGARLGGKGFTSAQDIIRTRGLKEIPLESVIAPEFLTGQTFPAIKRGQTAGALRSEFFQPILELGELGKAPRGFTALSGEPLGVIPKGDSFVFGGFSAPKVSPQFLRVGGERAKLFSFKGFLTGGKPTIARTEFAEVGFAPGVTGRTRRPLGRVPGEQLEFFGGGFKEGTGKLVSDFGEPQARRGSAFIPFVKTEKEAVTPFGTLIQEIGREFFIKFGGRRVPIVKLKAVVEPKLDFQLKGEKQTLGEFLEGSSRISPSSLITPEIGGFSFVPRRRIGGADFETSFIPSRSKSSLTSLTTSLISISPRRRVPRRRTPSRTRRTSSFTETFFSIPSSAPSRRRARPSPAIPILDFSPLPERQTTRKRVRKRKKTDTRKRKKVKVKKGKKRRGKIAPSFTSIIANLKGGLPEEFGSFGILPSRLRRLS